MKIRIIRTEEILPSMIYTSPGDIKRLLEEKDKVIVDFREPTNDDEWITRMGTFNSKGAWFNYCPEFPGAPRFIVKDRPKPAFEFKEFDDAWE